MLDRPPPTRVSAFALAPTLAVVVVVAAVAAVAAALSGPVAAQRRVSSLEQRAARWIGDLARADRRDAARRLLAGEGEEVVPILLAALERERGNKDRQRYLELILVLGKMGPAAASAVANLSRLLDGEDVEGESFLLWAIGEIGPAGLGAKPSLLSELQGLTIRRENFGWLAVVLARLELGYSPGRGVMMSYLSSGDLAKPSAAARLLVEGYPLDDELEALLLRAHEQAIVGWSRASDWWRPTALETCRAVVHCLPDSDLAVVARGYLLAHHDPDVRLAAASELADLGPRSCAALPQLIAALDDDNRLVVRQVLCALSLLGDAALFAVPAVETFGRRAPDRERRVLAEHAARKMRERLSGACWLCSEYEAADAERRAELRPKILAGGAAVARVLVDFLRHRRLGGDSDGSFEREAVRLLQDMNGLAAAISPELVDMVQFVDEELTSAILTAIGAAGPAALAALPDLPARLEDRVARAESHLLVVETRRALSRVLLSEQSTLDQLIAGLAHQSPSMRLRAARLVGARGPAARAAVEALEQLLAEEQPDVETVRRDPRTGGGGEVSRWIDLTEEIQVAAAEALVAIGAGPDTARRCHLLLIESRGAVARRRAAEALAQVDAPAEDVVEALRYAIWDPDPGVGRAAVTALGGLGPAASAAAHDLELAARHEDEELARRARRALAAVRR